MSNEKSIPEEQKSISNEPSPIVNENILQEQNVNQPETQNTKLQTENMEVHKHPHHVTHKKKWGEYFLEFLMIFLAVTLGFFAESYREYLTEHNREREYIHSLIEDLKSDQQVLARHISHIKTGVLRMDSVINILNTPSLLAKNTGSLYYLVRLAPRLNPLSTNNRTFEQLKNSGNFRLIQNLSTSNKIMTYYEKFPLIRMLESINETEFTEYKKVAAKIFDPAVFIKMEDKNGEIKRTVENPLLRATDNELLQELSVFSVYMNGTKKGILGADEEIKMAGAELIEYLRKKYHLESN